MAETSDAPRKFAVEHVESTTKSNRGSKEKEQESPPARPPRRFAPQPVETILKSSKKNGDKSSPPTKESSSAADISSQTAESSKPRRKFAPQLIETTKRSRKQGEVVPPTRQVTDKTDLSPGDYVHLPRHMRLERPSALPTAPENSPVGSTNNIHQITESRFSSSNLAKHAPRRTSFRTPRLEPINSLPESDESGPSNVPSLSTTPSADSEPIDTRKHVARLRESCDERFSGYLLALAARVAEQQLKEQAMAAYPNERMYEPVDHFGVDNDSTEDSGEEMGFGMLPQDDGPTTRARDRRESAAGWDLAEMRKHQANLQEQRQAAKEVEERLEQKRRSPPAQQPFSKPFGALPDIGPAKPTIGGPLGSPGELKKMRSAASPPMLGADLTFRTCPSPQQTMIDATQRPRRRDSSQGPISRQHSGLWTPAGSTAGTPKGTRKGSTAGLWGGHCQACDEPESLCVPGVQMQTGLMTPALFTPAVEGADPFSSFNVMGNRHQLPSHPPTPPASGSGAGYDIKITGIDDVLSAQASLEDEFPDAFVTQVYNYLSLGYPALAKKFDHELSKISRVPMADIRKDDKRRNTKGYVGAPEGQGCDEAAVKEACGRWRALRLYVREWGRQEGRMVGANRQWGQAVRRGSWAI
ncbi:MAG: hypothetical protein MMC23_002888 [Stictis urceolatum]|nr:hypothetical protein [Stictis urceolata]